MILTSHYTIASLPKSRNFLRGIPVSSMPYALRTAFDLLKLTPIKDSLTVNQVVTAFQNHETLLEDEIGRNSDDLITDLNQFISDNHLVRSSREASADDWLVQCWWGNDPSRSKNFQTCKISRETAEILFTLLGYLPDNPGLWSLEKIGLLFGPDGRKLLIGLNRSGTFFLGWTYRTQPPQVLDLRPVYEEMVKKHQENQEQDWRPTETLPEDFYTSWF